MAFTLKDAKEHVFRDVAGGSDMDSGLVVHRINQAVNALLKMQYADGEFGEWYVRTRGNRLLLPPDIQTAELITAYDSPVPVQAQWYRYMRHRVPCRSWQSCTPLEVHDMGDGHVTDAPLPCEQLLVAFSLHGEGAVPAESPGGVIYIQGRDANGIKIFSQDGSRTIDGVHLKISDTRPRMSEWAGHKVLCQQVTHVYKDETKWPVMVAGYVPPTDATDPDDEALLTPICTLMPWETSISRRLYEFSGHAPPEVRVFGRARYRPLRHDHEPLLIQDLEGILQAIFKLEAESRGDTGVAAYHKKQARESIDKSLDRSIGTTQTPLDMRIELPHGFGIMNGISNL